MPRLSRRSSSSPAPSGSWSRSATRSCRSCPMPRPAPRTGSSTSPITTSRWRPGTTSRTSTTRPTAASSTASTPRSFRTIPGSLVRVAQPASDATSTQTALGWLLVALVPAGAIVAAVVARLAAGRVLRPVGRLTETVERIRATGDLSAPIQTPGQDEISRLGQAFAAMTAALDESVGAQRRLVADASHELRTPLTSLITNLELLAEQPDDPSAPALAAAALAEAGELRVLINDLVDLARYGQASFHVEDVRLDLVAERVAARAASRAPGLRYELDCRPTLVRGDPDALERAIGNLVDNALKWSPPDGRIRISAGRRDGRGQRRRAGDSRGRPAVHFRSLLPVGNGPGAARLGPRPRDRAQDRRHARRNRRGDSPAARDENSASACRRSPSTRPARKRPRHAANRCAPALAAPPRPRSGRASPRRPSSQKPSRQGDSSPDASGGATPGDAGSAFSLR